MKAVIKESYRITNKQDWYFVLELKLQINAIHHLIHSPCLNNRSMMTSSNANSALLAFVRGFHRSPVNSPHKGQ